MITKNTLLSAVLGLSRLLPSAAVTVDTESFGQSLSGWRKNRTASYSLNNHPYRTHQPSVTPNPGGGIFVSTRVELDPKFGKKTASYLELSFSSAGTLLSAQIRIVMGGM